MHLLLFHPEKEMYAVGSGMNNGQGKNTHFNIASGKRTASQKHS